MKKNLILSFIISIFSFISFLLFTLQSYYIFEKVNNFIFLLIAFIYILVFSMITLFIVDKIFKTNKYREVSISFIIIMVGLLIINIIEMILLKVFINFEENNIIFFIVSLLQTLRLTFEFSIPIYVLVNILEFIRNKLSR